VRRHAGGLATGAALALVLLRSAAPLLFEGAFNSDQAVTGLMATHLVEGRAVPVFKYGQNYQLGVQAWLAAPLFALFGPSVFLLRLPLLLANLALAALLVRLLRRETGLGASTALLAAVPFLLAPPVTSMQFLEPSGGTIEPLLLAPVLWLLRRRPLAFGLVLAVGFLQRVFTIYALGALLILELCDRSLWSRETGRRYLQSGLVFAGVWQIVMLVRDRAAAGFGPSTPVSTAALPMAARTGSNVAEAVGRFCWDVALLPQRVVALLGEHLAIMFGGRRMPVSDLVAEIPGDQGVDGLWLLAGTALGAALARLTWLTVTGRVRPWLGRPRFGLFLFLTGVISAGVLVVSRCGPLETTTLRYTLHTVLGATGLTACYLAAEPARWPRRGLAAVLCLWALASTWSHGHLLATLAADPPRDQNRLLAEYLVARDIRYGVADYWDAYATVFWAGERVILASTTIEFITEYDLLVRRHPDEAVRISREPCPGGTRATERHWVCGPEPGAPAAGGGRR